MSHIAFVIQSLRTTVEVQTGYETPNWPYFIGICLILTCLSWVEDIKKFSATFLVGNLLILSTVIAVSGYCFWTIADKGPGAGIVPYNPAGFWTTVGFVIYSYEGIGIVMPVLSRAKEPELFNRCLIAAIATLATIFIFFGELTAFTFGASLTEPFITEMLPA